MKTVSKTMALLLAIGSGAALAADAAEIEAKFKAADKDSDGKLTLDEAKAGMPRIARGFDKIDAGKKGYVTLDEIKAKAGL